MESTQTIFTQTIKENRENPRLSNLIAEISTDLAAKRLQRLKDPTHIQKRIKELFGLFNHCLKEENLATQSNLSSIIDGLIKAASANEEALLFARIYEKEQLEKWIDSQRNHIKSLISSTYETIEDAIEAEDISMQKAFQDSKLRGIEMLGILKETVQEALLTTIEKGDDIEDTAAEITKAISYQAINEGDFTKQRFFDVARAIIGVCVEIADADQAFAKELLHGCVHGTKEGIAKAVEKFKNDLKYSPDEVEAIIGRDLSETKKELLKIEEEYVQMLKECSQQSQGISRGILKEIIDDELDSSYARIQRISFEAREAISERIEELRKNASIFEKEFKEKATKRMEELKKEMSELEKKAGESVENLRNSPRTQEARNLGIRAWEVAKGMMDGAIKGAKNAMKKDEK
jgi:hypothetical protein